MASSKPESKLIKAAGAVAWRPGPEGEPEILLVHRKKYDDWSLPKGKTEPGEPLPVTAVREVLEEGGARLTLGRRLVSVRYNVSGRPKRVHYWSASVTGANERAVPNAEVDEVAWLPAASAVERVTYTRDLGVLRDFAARPADTVPLILLRHAKAQSKSGWKGADIDRPLDDSGSADAKALAELLACFAPGARLISSPAVRCTETLRPFAHRAGAEPRIEDRLYIHHPDGMDRDYLRSLVVDAVAAGEPAVLCAHRENLPALQAVALEVLEAVPADAEVPSFGDIPREWPDTLPTAGFWVLNVAPLAAAPEPEPEPEPKLALPDPDSTVPAASSPEPGTDPAAPAVPGRRRWLRPRFRPSRARITLAGTLAGTLASTAGPDADHAIDADPASDAEAPSFEPVGVLASADRYDLSEA